MVSVRAKNKKALGGKIPLLLVWMLSCSGALWSQEVPDYWPLEVGNRWVYNHRMVISEDERLPDETVILEVVSRRRIDEKDYFELNNGQLLRKDEEGSIIERKGETDVVIFDMSHLDDPQYRFYIPEDAFPLTGGGSGYPASRSDSRGCSVTVPAGTFSCMSFSDGSFQELYAISFAEGVGPAVIQTYTDLPDYVNKYELVEYRIGGTTYPTAIREDSWAKVKRHHITQTLEVRR